MGKGRGGLLTALLLVALTGLGGCVLLGGNEGPLEERPLPVEADSIEEVEIAEDLPTPPPPLPPTGPPTEEVPQRENPFSDAILLQHAQGVSYGIYFFSEEILYASEDSHEMPAASVIKVFIMDYVFARIDGGELPADYRIAGQSIGELVRGMIQWSDNGATNVLIDYFGMESINQYLRERGFTETVLQRRMLDMEARNRGFDNYTSTGDVMAFLQRLYHNQGLYPYNEMLEIMKGQEVRTKMHLFLPAGTVVASKTGELHDVENDMGIVFAGDSAFALVVLTRDVRDTAAVRQAIGQLAREAYDYAAAG